MTTASATGAYVDHLITGCGNAAILAVYAPASIAPSARLVCGGCADTMTRSGAWALVCEPATGEQYTTDDDSPWSPQEACQACGTVDAQTDAQDDYGHVYRLCATCTADHDGQV